MSRPQCLSVCVTSLQNSMEKLIKEGYQFEARQTGCKMSKGDRSVTLDAVQSSLSVRAYTTAERARNVDARLCCTSGK